MKIELKFDGPATTRPTPYEPVKGLVLFRVMLSGREVWALLDNGSQASVVDEAFAREVGLPLGPADGTMVTPSGTMPWRPTRDVPLVIPGALSTVSPKAAAMDLGVISRAAGREIDFILGRDLMRLLQVWIDPDARELRLAPSGAVQPPARVSFLPLTGEPAMIEAKVGDAPVRLMVDFGASDALILTPEAWARLAPGQPNVGLRSSTDAQGSARPAPLGRLPAITIGPVTANDVPTAIRPWPTSQGDGVVGMGFLSRFRILMDIGQGKMWMLPRKPPEPPKPPAPPPGPPKTSP